ncbi:regulatory protein RecX [Merismopedia glauca]|uniref:Regulatory protein RecX n=1 Tax=Merismopedia glauca CCAP 1448/3 TaxID=1296344 RepID=A0A2T1C212_9CYAN|nr:regulatory protein RecX [Merismopedia glauca]PSB02325.1 RecX family transcriptional regulator [Merismopedia glauca CCAP 1448/3]
MNCQEYFLYLLARQEYSARDLSIKGQQKGFDPELIGTTIAHLQKQGYQSDTRLVAVLISASQGKYGRNVVKRKCFEKGISLELFEQVWSETVDLEEATQSLSQLKDKVMRKYHLNDLHNIDSKTKAKLWRYLQYRGFNPGKLLEQWQSEEESF